MESQFSILLGGLASLLMGVSLGVFGAGGSILTVPLLIYLFRLPASQATHYSLLVVGAVAALGVFWDRKSGKIPIRDLLWFALPAMLGMYLVRNFALPALPENIELFGMLNRDKLLLIVFSLFMITASASMIFVKIKDRAAAWEASSAETAILAAIGLLVGAATGFVGAGGGFLIVPALVFFAGIAVSEATLASLFVIMLNSLWGFFTSIDSWKSIPWSVLTLVIAGACVGMIFGLRLKKKIAADALKPAFGVFVLAMGTYVLWRSLAA